MVDICSQLCIISLICHFFHLFNAEKQGTLIDIVNALGISADMVLCDVVNTGYGVRHSLLAERLEKLPQEDRAKIYDVIETMIRHSTRTMP